LAGITDNPRLESELLLTSVLNCTRVYLLAHPEILLTEEQTRVYRVKVNRRVNNEPLPYIIGSMEFCGLQFLVTPHVLIPRPETEQIVELTTDWIAERSGVVVVDVGTGSGAIAVALAHYAKCQYIYATDISLPALRVAKENAARHQVSENIGFINCDLLTPFRCIVNVIVSNPPYIAESEYVTLPQSIQHEPRKALIAGKAGLLIIERLLRQAKHLLASNGLLLVEIGWQQGKAVLAAAKTTFPRASVKILKDLSGLDRILCVQCNKKV
jgi:release factor glutamine methyltransferase